MATQMTKQQAEMLKGLCENRMKETLQDVLTLVRSTHDDLAMLLGRVQEGKLELAGMHRQFICTLANLMSTCTSRLTSPNEVEYAVLKHILHPNKSSDTES